MPQNERKAQGKAIAEWTEGGGWAQSIHPSLGMKQGIPDTMFFVGGMLIPIEFKWGHTNDGLLMVEEIRPAQRGWHKRFKLHGGLSGVIVATFDEWYTLTIAQFLSGRDCFGKAKVKRHKTASEAVQWIARSDQCILQQRSMEVFTRKDKEAGRG